MERKLVERAMHGDEAAFDALIGRLGDQLHSVARRILRDPYLAEDATQRALLHAWRNLPSLRDPDRFEAWLYRLLRGHRPPSAMIETSAFSKIASVSRRRPESSAAPHSAGSSWSQAVASAAETTVPEALVLASSASSFAVACSIALACRAPGQDPGPS